MSGGIVVGREVDRDLEITCDVAIVGSGPGGAITAALLAARGAKVIVLEEGPAVTKADFDLMEETAYPKLYQDGGSRSTDDLAIMILQGRCLGGGSTVNWMTSLRTPETTLERWRTTAAVHGVTTADLSPHWDAIEDRLSIHPAVDADVNANNRVLLDGAARLGLTTSLLPRNSRDCDNLGYCGMGCPIDAKMDARLTWLSDAQERGTVLYAECRAERVVFSGGRAVAIEAGFRNTETSRPTGRRLTVRADRFVLSGGAINTPALLLRSGYSKRRAGTHTWLHPVVATIGEFDREILPWYGSPQSVACNDFRERGDRMGFFIETPPIHPMLGALALPALGIDHHDLMSSLSHCNALIGLTVDGFSEEEKGGTVTVKGGRLRFHYDLAHRNREAIVEAMKVMARIQLAAGAKRVMTLHTKPIEIRSEKDLAKIDSAPFGPNRLSLFTAHQMGGCAMGESERSVVDSRGRLHGVANVTVADGSVFPTSLGVNPMLSIYGVASLFAASMK